MKFAIIGLIIEWHETLGNSLMNLSRVESSTTGLKMFASADEEIKHKHEIQSFINLIKVYDKTYRLKSIISSSIYSCLQYFLRCAF